MHLCCIIFKHVYCALQHCSTNCSTSDGLPPHTLSRGPAQSFAIVLCTMIVHSVSYCQPDKGVRHCLVGVFFWRDVATVDSIGNPVHISHDGRSVPGALLFVGQVGLFFWVKWSMVSGVVVQAGTRWRKSLNRQTVRRTPICCRRHRGKWHLRPA